MEYKKEKNRLLLASPWRILCKFLLAIPCLPFWQAWVHLLEQNSNPATGRCAISWYSQEQKQ
jgi:hypothetical protein